jgi:hypothetical protein
VVPVITDIIIHFILLNRCISIPKLLYFFYFLLRFAWQSIPLVFPHPSVSFFSLHYFLYSWPLKMGPIGCTETAVGNYDYTVHNFLEEHRCLFVLYMTYLSVTWPRGLLPLAYCDRGFEYHRRYGCLSVVCVMCCQVEVSATSWSLVQKSLTNCDASVCVIKKSSGQGGHSPRWAAEPEKIIINMTYLQ